MTATRKRGLRWSQPPVGTLTKWKRYCSDHAGETRPPPGVGSGLCSRITRGRVILVSVEALSPTSNNAVR
jgi:hypothetical protein